MAARKAKSAEAVAALGEQQERMEALLEEAKVTSSSRRLLSKRTLT